MIKIINRLVTGLLLSCAIFTAALAKDVNLTGLWQHTQDKSPSAIIINENMSNHTLQIMGTYPKDNQQVVWIGAGKVQGNKVTITYNHSQNFHGFGGGNAVMKIKQNGNRLEGSLKSDTGKFEINHMIWQRVPMSNQ